MSITLRKTKTEYPVRNAYQEPIKVSTSVILDAKNSGNEARTNQSFKKSCDINSILNRYHKTGVIEHVSKYAPEYGEVSSLDFEQAFNLVKETREMFDELPAIVRQNFNNSPENFLAYMENPDNRNEESLLTTTASRKAETTPSVSGDTTEESTTESAK